MLSGMARIAIVGGGSIGEALLSGLLRAGRQVKDLVVVERVPERADYLAATYSVRIGTVPDAVESARRSAAAMGVQHAEFVCADAGETAQRLAGAHLAPDCIVLDPPRKGCDDAALQAVARMAPPRIVMVSCNPATAARDAAALVRLGYAVRTVQPVDMFPRTKHVETVVLMSRVEGK